jgi:predicted dehydrogenase
MAILSRWHVHADGYAKQIRESGRAEIACVWDENRVRGKEWADELYVDFIEDLDDLLSSNNIDAVVVTVPTVMHKEILVKSAKAGKHILCEKVPVMSVKELLEVEKAVNETGVFFVLAEQFKAIPEYIYAKKVIAKNTIGKVVSARIRFAHNGLPTGFLPSGFMDPAECGQGAMLDTGAHPMYLSAWLFGEPLSIVSVFNKGEGLVVDDNSISIIEYPGNVLAVVETAISVEPTLRSMEISGTAGTLRTYAPLFADSAAPVRVEIALRKRDGTFSYNEVSQLPERKPAPLIQLINSILDGSPIEYGMREAFVLTVLMEGAYLSNKTKSRVQLNEGIMSMSVLN